MVSCDNTCTSDILPAVLLLENTLLDIINRTLKAEQLEEVDFLTSQDLFCQDTIPVRPQYAQKEVAVGARRLKITWGQVFQGWASCHPNLRSSMWLG